MSESHFLHKTNCDECGSSDAKACYSNGSTYCFSCTNWEKEGDAGEPVATGIDVSKFTFGGYKPVRGLSVETCEKFGYQINEYYREDCDTHIAPYYDRDGKLAAQHLRFEGDKSAMPWKKPNKDSELQMFGQNKFASGKKQLVITEGEIDCMSVSQALGNTWPVVAIAGASTIKKALKQNLAFVESFEKIILFFDNDEPGKQATKEALEILPFGKAFYVNEFPEGCKDANDILVKHGSALLRTTTLFKSQEFTPSGVTEVKDIKFSTDDFNVSMFPWDNWNKKLFARRGGELTVYTAGTGIGKSTVLRFIYSDLLKQGEKCAGIFLEESVEETKADLMSTILGKPIRKILAAQAINRQLEKKGKPILFPDVEMIPSEDIESAESELNSSNMILIDHSKGYDVESILSQIRYLAISKGVQHILLDHISLLISSDSEIDNEVKATDVIMKKFRVLAQETGINLDIISHVRKRGNGSKSVNKGAEISIEELRGSGSLGQVANNVLVLERDQQNPEDTNLTVCRSLKSRLGGYTGVIGSLRYCQETGSLTEEDGQDNNGFSSKESSDY